MKIAFLIFGMTRNYKKCAATFLENVLSPCNGDIFVSFRKGTEFLNDDGNTGVNDFTFLLNLFGDHLKFFEYDDENVINDIKQHNLNRIYNSFDVTNDDKIRILYSIDQYARVKNIASKFEDYCSSNNVKYDIVVRLRLDRLYWKNIYNITEQIKDPTKIYIMKTCDTRCVDYIFFGETVTMIEIMKNFVDNMYSTINVIDNAITKSIALLPEIQISTEFDKYQNKICKIQPIFQQFVRDTENDTDYNRVYELYGPK